MENKYMLTTFDNPFNPFVDFSSWYMFDCEMNHNTCSRLARIAELNSEMTEKEINEEKDRAMNFIVKYDLECKFFKGTEEQIQKWIESKDFNKYLREKQTATATNAQCEVKK